MNLKHLSDLLKKLEEDGIKLSEIELSNFDNTDLFFQRNIESWFNKNLGEYICYCRSRGVFIGYNNEVVQDRQSAYQFPTVEDAIAMIPYDQRETEWEWEIQTVHGRRKSDIVHRLAFTNGFSSYL